MFVHAPEKREVTVASLVLWDDSELAYHAVDVCRRIESRLEDIRFRIEEADLAELKRRADDLRTKACDADLVVVAVHRSLADLPESVKRWFRDWSAARQRQAGGLAVVRPWDRMDEEQFRRWLSHRGEQLAVHEKRDREFRRFAEECARRAHMELFWGCLESELEEATRGMRILEAQPSGHLPGGRLVAA